MKKDGKFLLQREAITPQLKKIIPRKLYGQAQLQWLKYKNSNKKLSVIS